MSKIINILVLSFLTIIFQIKPASVAKTESKVASELLELAHNHSTDIIFKNNVSLRSLITQVGEQTNLFFSTTEFKKLGDQYIDTVLPQIIFEKINSNKYSGLPIVLCDTQNLKNFINILVKRYLKYFKKLDLKLSKYPDDILWQFSDYLLKWSDWVNLLSKKFNSHTLIGLNNYRLSYSNCKSIDYFDWNEDSSKCIVVADNVVLLFVGPGFFRLDFERKIKLISFLPNNNILIITENNLFIINFDTQEVLLRGQLQNFQHVAFNKNNNLLVFVFNEKISIFTIDQLNINADRNIHDLGDQQINEIEAIKINNAGTHMALKLRTHIILYNVTNHHAKNIRYNGRSTPINDFCFSPDNKILALVIGNKIRFANYVDEVEIMDIIIKADEKIKSVKFSSDMKYFLLTKKNGDLVILNWANKNLEFIINFKQEFYNVSFSQDNNYLVINFVDGTTKVLSLENSIILKNLDLNFSQKKLLTELAKIERIDKVVKLSKEDKDIFDSLPAEIQEHIKNNLKIEMKEPEST